MTSVAPCSPPSRTLRAGYAGADGILDIVCARRCRVRQVGTKEWSPVAEQRNEAHCLTEICELPGLASYRVRLLRVEHRAESRRSPTLRNARAWPCPRCRTAA